MCTRLTAVRRSRWLGLGSAEARRMDELRRVTGGDVHLVDGVAENGAVNVIRIIRARYDLGGE